jgi:hypothetical protein
MRNTDHTHSVQVSAQLFVIASPDHRCRMLNVASAEITALPFSKIAAECASFAATLIEGAVSAGLVETRQTTSAKSYTLPRYIRWLAGNYIFAGQTPDQFRRGAERFHAAGRLDLAKFAMIKAAEETGHAELAYRDLEALGLPAKEVIRLVQPPSANLFAERFRSHVESNNPITLFGFSYCLERMAVERDAAFIRKVEAILPPGSRATRFLKVHSNTGSDSGHVQEQLAMFNSLDDTELAVVVRAAYETAELLSRQPLMDAALSDEEICRRLGIQNIAPSPVSAEGIERR